MTRSLSVENFGWTVTGKLKDMIILESVLAKMLTSKIVHKYLSNVLVKFENLLTPNFGLIFFTLHVQILLIILPTSFLSVISPFDLLFR